VSKQSKPLIWLHAEVKTPPFSADARIEAGVLLRQLQDGIKLSLPHSRPMPSMGIGCHELRIQDENSTWRIVYYINSVAIVILEVFSKTTLKHHPSNTTSCLDRCKARLKTYKSI
jgi:phage-related protein